MHVCVFFFYVCIHSEMFLNPPAYLSWDLTTVVTSAATNTKTNFRFIKVSFAANLQGEKLTRTASGTKVFMTCLRSLNNYGRQKQILFHMWKHCSSSYPARLISPFYVWQHITLSSRRMAADTCWPRPRVYRLSDESLSGERCVIYILFFFKKNSWGADPLMKQICLRWGRNCWM